MKAKSPDSLNSSAIKRVKPLGFPWETADPFLFCVHHDDAYPAGNGQLGPQASLKGRNLGNDFEGKDGWRMYHGEVIPGFPQHPHRGFETVTVAWEGAVAHRDNAGNAGIIGPGDVQWMTAGAGILHEEYHEREFARAGGRVHMTQLWVNLPKKDKMTAPGYQPITAAQIPTVTLADGAGTVRVIAGEYGGAAGPARTFTPITMLDARLAAGGRLPVRLPSTHNALAIVTDGRVRVGTRHATAGELVLFENDGAELDVLALEETHLLVLAGEPIDEPITQYGPFVMNTPAEIQQAFVDFRQGKFGDVPE